MKEIELATCLIHSPIFKHLGEEEVCEILQKHNYQRKSYPPETLIISAGEELKSLMILLSGEARGEVLDISGNSIKIEDITAPRPLAPAFLFGAQNIAPVTVITNVTTEIISLPKEQLLQMFQNNQTVLKNFLNIISSRGQFLSQKIKLLSFKNLNQRLAFFIIKEGAQGPLKKFNQQQLAELLRATRPALARTLSQMKQEGILSYERGEIHILSKNKLYELLKGFPI